MKLLVYFDLSLNNLEPEKKPFNKNELAQFWKVDKWYLHDCVLSLFK